MSSERPSEGLSRAVQEHEENRQETLTDEDLEPENDPNTVYVVATNYDGDPHPHVEAVFSDEEDAKDLKKKCAAVAQPPHPIAWQVLEMEVR